jgi:transcriptional regulator with XRE-family HTH domain
MKVELGKQIETLRKKLGVSTYELERKGIHPSLPSTIEKGQKGYSIDSLIKYLNAINETYLERKEKTIGVKLEIQVLGLSNKQTL